MKFEWNGQYYDLVLLVLTGSRQYGTNTLKSDYDYRGVFVAHQDTKVGMLGCIEQIDGGGIGTLLSKMLPDVPGLDSKDVVLYEIRKFFKLATDNNPGLLDVLFADQRDIAYCNDKGERILFEAPLFLSKKAKFTFSGYAYSQLARIKNHKKWITRYPDAGKVLDAIERARDAGDIDFCWTKDFFGGDVANLAFGPEDREKTVPKDVMYLCLFADTDIDPENYVKYIRPQMRDFMTFREPSFKKIGLEKYFDLVIDLYSDYVDYSEIGRNTYAVYRDESIDNRGGVFCRDGKLKRTEFDPKDMEPIFVMTFDETGYKAAEKEFRDLWSWKTNRNKDRSEMEDKIGYDCKSASHLIRLMVGGVQILNRGTFSPRLSGDSLNLVRDVRNCKKTYEEVIEIAECLEKTMEILYNVSDLQKEPNRKKINKLLLELSK